jgi:hypothetical protein
VTLNLLSPQGPVVNVQDVTVGELVGDGVSLKFTDVSHIGNISICLRVLSTADSSNYPVKDFGYAMTNGSFIYPLGWRSSLLCSFPFSHISISGLSAAIQTEVLNGVTFWCGNVSFAELQSEGNIVSLFPVYRSEDYATADQPYVSEQTKALMYTLGVLYCLLGFLFLLMIV